MTLFDSENKLSLLPMRDYQSHSVNETRRVMSSPIGWRCVVLNLPTGAGKTVIAAHVIAAALSKGHRVLFVVPMLSLIGKTIKSFEAQGIVDIGVIQARHSRTNHLARVQVASKQTLIRRPEMMDGYKLVLDDECHERYEEFATWMKRAVGTRFVGLSATPWAKGMGLDWDGVVIGATMKQLLEKGAICPFEVYEPDHLPDRKKVKKDGEDFQAQSAELAMSQRELVADVYEMWEKRGKMGKWFVLAQTCKHAQLLMEDFVKNGVRCGYIDSETPSEEREDIFSGTGILPKFRTGEIEVLFSVGCLGTGVDEDVRGISLAYLTKSRMKLTQDMGRGGRNALGKKVCYIHDHGGNTHALGMPEDYVFESLDMGGDDSAATGEAKPSMEPAEPKRCKACKRVLPPQTRVCSCGVEIPRTGAVPETVKGQLVLRGGGEMIPLKKKIKPKVEEKQAFYSGFLDMQQRYGFRDGWAANRYREWCGVWPKGLAEVPMTPRKAVRDFNNEQMKAYRAEKQRESAAKREAVSA